jgi:hypothetical protein
MRRIEFKTLPLSLQLVKTVEFFSKMVEAPGFSLTITVLAELF